MRVLIIVMVVFLAFAGYVTAQEVRPGQQPGQQPTPQATKDYCTVAVLVDTTSSLQAAAPRGGTRQALFHDGLRVIILAAERAGCTLVVGRLCGISETLWNAPFERRDRGKLGTLIRRGIATCTSAFVPSASRVGGTDLVLGVRWLEAQAKNAHLCLLTDGLHQPPSRGGQFAQEELYAELRRLSPQVRDRLTILGVDEFVRQEFANRVPRVYGLYDFMIGVQQFITNIGR